MHTQNEGLPYQKIFGHLWESRLDTECDIAGYCLLIYDYLLTLDSERALIWSTPLNLGKILFFCVRYIPFLSGGLLIYVHTATPSTPFHLCSIMFQTAGALIYIVMICSEATILFRTCALVGAGRRGYYIQWTLIILTVCLVIISTVYVYLTIRPPEHYGHLPHGFHHFFTQCARTYYDSSTRVFGSYIVGVCFETLLFVLMLYKCLKLKKYSNSLFIKTLLRDGVMYYFCLSVVSIINICIIKLRHAPGRFILFQQVLHSIFAARIMINLRKVVHHERRLRSMQQCSTSKGGSGYLSSVILGVETWFQPPDDPQNLRGSILAT